MVSNMLKTESPAMKSKAQTAQKPDFVTRFVKPVGTEIKHIGQNWYLYERLSRYDPAIGRSRKVSGKCLGKLTETGLVPTKRRLRSAGDMRISDTVDAGTTVFYWNRTAQLRQRLAAHFPDLWKWIYATAILRASQDCRFRRLCVHYENSLLAHIFPDLSFTPSAISATLDALGRRRDDIAAFMQQDVSSKGRFVLFDGHRIVTSSRTMELAEKGYDSKMRYMPQTNLIYVYSLSEQAGAPVYYKQFVGSTPDVTAFADILRECGLEGADYTVIADKGFGSEQDFLLMDELKLRHIVPLKRGNRFIAGRVPASPTQYQHCFTYHGRAILCSAFEEDGFTVHLYYDAQLFADETADAVARMEKRNNTNARLSQIEQQRRNRGEPRLTDAEFLRLAPEGVTDVYADGNQMGTVTIRTNRRDLNSEQVYVAYKQRQAIEQYFRMYGNSMDFDASYMRNRTDQEAWLFLNHLSAAIGIPVIEELGRLREGKTVSFEDLNAALKRITAARIAGEWQIAPVKKATCNILRKIGFNIQDENIDELLKQARRIK